MALSRTAREHAGEIRQHDWSDAPYRLDRAGHNRPADSASKLTADVLSEAEASRVRWNVMWVTAQVLGYQDPNFDVYEFAEACGINTNTTSGRRHGGVAAGLRMQQGRYARPGTFWEFDDEK